MAETNVTTINRIQCSICDGIFHRESEGQMFCLLCLKLWLDGEGLINCINCHRREKQKNMVRRVLKTLNCGRVRYDPIEKVDFDYDIGRGIASETCITHNEPHLYYCCTCRKAICRTCVTYTHERQGHSLRSVVDMCPEQKTFTREMCDVLKERLEREQDYIKDIDDCLEEITQCVLTATEEINQSIHKRIQSIKASGDMLKRQLKHIQMTKSASLSERRSRAVLLVENMEKALLVAAKSVRAYPAYVYAAKHEDINENMLKLCIEQQHEHRVLSGRIQFVPDRTALGYGYLGKLLHRRSLKRETTFGEFKNITAIAGCPDGHLAIFDKATKDVVVYKKQDDYCQTCVLSEHDEATNGMKVKRDASTDIAVTSTGQLLISNLTGVLDQFDLRTCTYTESFSTSKSAVPKRWIPRHSPFKFSVTSDNEIVIGSAKQNKVHILDPGGKLLRTFQVEVSPTNHLATNGREIAYTNSFRGKLCVLNFHTGETMWTVDAPGVAGVCFDDESGSILITRNTVEDAGVIEQFCICTGEFIGRLVDEIERPDDLTSLCGDQIAVSNKTYIQIFSIQ